MKDDLGGLNETKSQEQKRPKRKKVFILASVLVVVGFLVCIAGYATTGFNLKYISGSKQLFEASEVGANLNLVEIDTRNDKIDIRTSVDDRVRITYWEYVTYGSYSLEYGVINSAGKLILTKNSFARSRIGFFDWRRLFESDHGVTVELPKDFKGELNIRTSNAHVEVNDTRVSGNTYIITSNAAIEIRNSEFGSSLTGGTSNGGIEFHSVNARDVDMRTSNSGIIMDYMNVKDKISLTTSNGRIESRDVTSNKEVYLKSSNSGMDVERITSDNIRLETSNGTINVWVNGKEEEYSIHPSTSNSGSHAGTDPKNDHLYEKSVRAATNNGDVWINFSIPETRSENYKTY